ncbi:hypothetical protein EZV62_004279 [Acer yangbiense]|uniref:Phytocyanin domain-containing protein n=1 Tax=Acer yangbiense TaxID=1000413 RepID=A0A5C7IKD6_9ROSI|nr:hypothetical protein EZV62_004279 [Acer yangbiense]
MAKFVMMSMVFTVVLLKSAAITNPTEFPKTLPLDSPKTLPLDSPKTLPTEHMVGDGTWDVPKEGDTDFYKNWADNKKFFVGDKLTFKFAPYSHVKRVTEAAYETCHALNSLNTIEDLITDGNGLVNVNLYSTGVYYFISPVYDNCIRGLRLYISVSPPPSPPVSSSPVVSVGVLVPMMAVVLGFFF